MTTMTCPKCRGDMHNYERNGVTVDQCGECRGIFLDRGELEHLLAADARAHTSAPAAAAPPRSEPRSESHEYRDDDSHHSSYGSYGSHGSSKKRKKHWMEELFD